jgi:hypothetical protein
MKKIWIVTIQKNPDNEDEFEIMGVFKNKKKASGICKDIRYCIFQMPFDKELPFESFYPDEFDRPNLQEPEDTNNGRNN